MTQKSDEEKAMELANEIFSKTFLVLLAHVQRRIAKDPNYEEPKFLRAFLMAFEGINNEDVKDGENFMGVATGEDPTEAYAVVIKKQDSGFEIMELRDIVRGKTVGQREIMRLIQFSILLDNIDGNSISWSKATEALHMAVPGIRFVKFPNNQWRKYRKKLLARIKNGKIADLTSSDGDVKKLESATSFSKVPQRIRTLIGFAYTEEKYPKQKTMSITSPDTTVEKSRLFDMAKDLIYGVGADYLNPMEYLDSE